MFIVLTVNILYYNTFPYALLFSLKVGPLGGGYIFKCTTIVFYCTTTLYNYTFPYAFNAFVEGRSLGGGVGEGYIF